MVPVRSSLVACVFITGVVVSCGGTASIITDAGPDRPINNSDGMSPNPDGALTPDVVGPACSSDAQCSLPTPYCDPSAHVCVECLGDPNCASAQNGAHFCNLGTHTCVQCTSSAQCGGGQGAYCSPGGRCVECLADGNCGPNQKCNLNDYLCVTGCTTDAQCAVPDPYCNMMLGYCVECLSNTNCPLQRPICDTASDSCVQCMLDTDCKDPGQPRCYQGAHQCVECLTNADCPGSYCQPDHTCQ